MYSSAHPGHNPHGRSATGDRCRYADRRPDRSSGRRRLVRCGSYSMVVGGRSGGG